jgi:hypothetical protein
MTVSVDEDNNKPTSSASLSNANSVVHVKVNANNYLPNAESSNVRGLLNIL